MSCIPVKDHLLYTIYTITEDGGIQQCRNDTAQCEIEFHQVSKNTVEFKL